jgi:hypothetical protein
VEFLLVLLPAVSCAALMFICFRAMRHADTGAASPEKLEDDAALRAQMDVLREEVTTLRAQLDRERSAPDTVARGDNRRHAGLTTEKGATWEPRRGGR